MKIKSLSNRRKYHRLVSVLKCLSGEINCSQFLVKTSSSHHNYNNRNEDNLHLSKVIIIIIIIIIIVVVVPFSKNRKTGKDFNFQDELSFFNNFSHFTLSQRAPSQSCTFLC